MLLQFQTVDVFTSERFSGNPLAVVLNAQGLTTEQMQAIAAQVKTRAALASATPYADVFRKDIVKHGVTGILIYAHVDGEDVDIRARMFAPLKGIPEDPATGSANVALIGLLAKLRPEPDLQLSKTIAQGVEMGRPSLLYAQAEKRGGVVTATYIGGRCVPVMSGSIELV